MALEGSAAGLGSPPRRVIAYTVVATLGATALFTTWLMYLPDLKPDSSGQLLDAQIKQVFVMTIVLMFVAGVIGGCLYNFRGLTKHASLQDYAANYNLSYYLRPLSGGSSGLIVFFLLLGGAITFGVDSPGAGSSWTTLTGRMPYIAFALLAGYGSQEFMTKLKDLADSLFAIRGSGGNSGGGGPR
jgi:hypothetical protein